MLTQEMDMDISVIRPRKLAHSQMDMDMDISNSLTRAISTHKRGISIPIDSIRSQDEHGHINRISTTLADV